MSNYENMNKTELEQRHAKLIEELEELEEERMFVLGQTGLHVPGATVKKYEAEIEGIKKHIKLIENILKDDD